MFCIFLLVGCSTKQENITIKKNNNQETVDLKVGFGLHHIEDGYSFEGNDVEELTEKVLHEARVFITPGFIFGSNGKRYIRISLCAKEEKLAEALERIKKIM